MMAESHAFTGGSQSIVDESEFTVNSGIKLVTKNYGRCEYDN